MKKILFLLVRIRFLLAGIREWFISKEIKEEVGKLGKALLKIYKPPPPNWMRMFIFLLVFLALPVGVKAQYSWKPDKVICNPAQDSCWWIYNTGTIWIDSLGNYIYDCDSFFVDHNYPNWQDSIEQCKEEIKEAEKNLNQAQYELLHLSPTAELYGEVEFGFRVYNDARLKLSVLNLQLQIFLIQQKLQRTGIE